MLEAATPRPTSATMNRPVFGPVPQVVHNQSFDTDLQTFNRHSASSLWFSKMIACLERGQELQRFAVATELYSANDIEKFIREEEKKSGQGVRGVLTDLKRRGYTLRQIDDLLRQIDNEEARKVFSPRTAIHIQKQPPKAVTVIEGNTLELQVVALGFPKPKAWWFKGTHLFDGQDQDLHYIKENVTQTDTGQYRCRLMNSDDPNLDVHTDAVEVNVIRRRTVNIKRHPQENPLRYLADGKGDKSLHLYCNYEPRDWNPTSFKWLLNDVELEGYSNFHIGREVNDTIAGNYQCVVTWEDGFTITSEKELVEVKIGRILAITRQPSDMKCHPGASIIMNFDMNRYLNISCKWFFNGQLVDDQFIRARWKRENVSGEDTPSLKIMNVSHCHAGKYSCQVKGPRDEECLTTEATITMEEGETYVATQKIALLIGNAIYDNETNFQTLLSLNDLIKLKAELEELNFVVMSFYNLNKSNMQRVINMFVELLVEGSYGLFYFSGHGFQEGSNNFLVPTDAPSAELDLKETIKGYINMQMCTEKLESKNPALLAVILDTCRKSVQHALHSGTTIPNHEPTVVGSSTVTFHLTSYGLSAYEIPGRQHNVFVQYITEENLIRSHMPLEEIFREVQRRISRDPRLAGLDGTQRRQVPEICSRLAQKRSLKDVIISHEFPLQQHELLYQLNREIYYIKSAEKSYLNHFQITISRPVTNVIIINVPTIQPIYQVSIVPQIAQITGNKKEETRNKKFLYPGLEKLLSRTEIVLHIQVPPNNPVAFIINVHVGNNLGELFQNYNEQEQFTANMFCHSQSPDAESNADSLTWGGEEYGESDPELSPSFQSNRRPGTLHMSPNPMNTQRQRFKGIGQDEYSFSKRQPSEDVDFSNSPCDLPSPEDRFNFVDDQTFLSVPGGPPTSMSLPIHCGLSAAMMTPPREEPAESTATSDGRSFTSIPGTTTLLYRGTIDLDAIIQTPETRNPVPEEHVPAEHLPLLQN